MCWWELSRVPRKEQESSGGDVDSLLPKPSGRGAAPLLSTELGPG